MSSLHHECDSCADRLCIKVEATWELVKRCPVGCESEKKYVCDDCKAALDFMITINGGGPCANHEDEESYPDWRKL